MKDFIDTNRFTKQELMDIIELSLEIKKCIEAGYSTAAEKSNFGNDFSAVFYPDEGFL